MTPPAIHISIAKDFSPYPHGRHPEDGNYSGEKFRNEILAPCLKEALRRNEKLVVDLDGVKALGSSFAEEAFGGLIRHTKIPAKTIIEAIDLKYTKPWLRPFAENIKHYMKDAAGS